MMSQSTFRAILIIISCCIRFECFNNKIMRREINIRRQLLPDSNTDLFGGPSSSNTNEKISVTDKTAERLQDKAARLRQEAEEMEISMREEARAKGIPDEMINKLIPQRKSPSQAANPVISATTSVVDDKIIDSKLSRSDLRSKLGYLSIGNPVKFNSELRSLSSKNYLAIWNSFDIGLKPNYSVNNYQLKSKTNIDPVNLKLDDVGFNYQSVLVTTVIGATVFGLSSSYIPGQIGFILGYFSVLTPVLLLGLGSVAPAAIGDILRQFKLLTNEDARKRYIRFQAGRFIVGYVLGLPISKYGRSGQSDFAEFFQLRPPVVDSDGEGEMKKFFSKSKFSQLDISPYSIVCLAGPVAECLEYEKASGFSPNDVNVLNSLLLAVEPVIAPERAQDHIKWSALQSYNILSKYKTELNDITEAFARGASLEECLSIMEGK